ncbi:cupin [Bradyrhizobium sp. SSBR45G]|uniref:cupin domain-containing protein n=1 Tax=unclassified Bradyrhizobium TaxID=2631580 RepID=UPI0023429DCD|nr:MULTISPECIES: cupin domain-containing protein [unclassified Bradyrhizobium]GLH81900.1 cupin [Bradyrhizobium sp. SSBR45G]GLH89379.1 cupin [Bradyrhizobium sp. SSBR45R]
MSPSLIETANLTVDLAPAPIEPSWIIEGNPTATSCTVARSSDGLGSTIVWHCTEGKFNWYYDFDETILILDGAIVLESDGLPAKRYGPGDVIFFRDGAHAKWHVEGHVKKLAFCLKTQPYVLGLAVRVMGKLKRMFLTPEGRRGTSLAGA